MSVYVDETQHMGLGLRFIGGGCLSVAVGLEKKNTRCGRKPYHTPNEKTHPHRYSPSGAGGRKFADPGQNPSRQIVRIFDRTQQTHRRCAPMSSTPALVCAYAPTKQHYTGVGGRGAGDFGNAVDR